MPIFHLIPFWPWGQLTDSSGRRENQPWDCCWHDEGQLCGQRTSGKNSNNTKMQENPGVPFWGRIYPFVSHFVVTVMFFVLCVVFFFFLSVSMKQPRQKKKKKETNNKILLMLVSFCFYFLCLEIKASVSYVWKDLVFPEQTCRPKAEETHQVLHNLSWQSCWPEPAIGAHPALRVY